MKDTKPAIMVMKVLGQKIWNHLVQNVKSETNFGSSKKYIDIWLKPKYNAISAL